MVTKRIVYVVEPRPNGNWAAQRSGTERAATVKESKSAAINEARKLAQHYPLSQVVIKNERGRVEREFTYGEDPRNRRG